MNLVAQNLGGEILRDSRLRQPGDMLEGESVLEAFERFLYAPALVVQITDDGGGKRTPRILPAASDRGSNDNRFTLGNTRQ